MTLNITMIGESNSGKTTFLSAVANMILGGTRQGGYGFKFIAPTPAISSRYKKSWTTLQQGEWGPPSQLTQEYTFHCKYDDSPFKVRGVDHVFTLIDHRGGLIKESNSDTEQEKYLQCLNKSNAIIVCLGADRLGADPLNFGTANIDDYHSMLNYSVSKSPESFKEYTFIVAITKSDLFNNTDQVRKSTKFIENKFGSYFDRCRAAMIIPVAIGKKLTGEFVQGGRFKGQVAPVNFHLPILFAFYTATRYTREHTIFHSNNERMEAELLKELANDGIMYYQGNRLIPNKFVKCT